MARVLVTGGAGDLGSHARKALAEAGHEPIVYDNLVYGHEDNVKWGPFEEGDIRDADRLDMVFARHKPDLVMHFAAFAYVGESMVDPAKYYVTNVGGSINLLEAMRRNGCGQIIFSSTCATYGEPEQLPITEATPQLPVNPYGMTKLTIERAMQDYAAAYGLRWVAFRYFNAAGCDPDGELGERHDPETHVIPLAIEAALDDGAGRRFRVMGTDYPTPDGTCLRDYIHVSDLADAHVLGIDYLLGGGCNTAFNLATGRPTSVRQIVDAVEKATGRTVPTDYAPRRAGDPAALFAVSNMAREVLGWKPRFTDIDETIATAARWFAGRNTSALQAPPSVTPIPVRSKEMAQ
ncbi:MAG: UDP-glucose 4-epimerase GalE [Pseudomonadota bacterium]